MALRVRSFVLATLLLALFVFIGQPVLAQSDTLSTTANTAGFGTSDLITVIGTIIKVFLGILGILFLVLMMYAGFLWMTAGGDGKQVDRAKRMLINAVVGLVIILMSYAIASFIVNALLTATGGNGNNGGPSGSVTIPSFSGSLGSGIIRDHYPLRDQTDVVRNTNITVTFRDQMEIKSMVSGYDDAGTPLDLSDDSVTTTLNSDNVKIYASAEGEETALTDVEVHFTDDLKTFVFNPVNYLGNSTGPVGYTVHLDKKIKNAAGQSVFVGANSGGYEWSFDTGVDLDLSPPTVTSVTPASGGTFAKNIVVQINFNEPVDPTSASGVRAAGSGFSNIQVAGTDGIPTPGNYYISNGYKTVTFESASACGTNSCGETIYCLPGGQPIAVGVAAATVGSSPPQANFPYNGVVDMAANSLDGDRNGVAGDEYAWAFSTTDDIYLLGSSVQSITPNIQAENVALDEGINLIFSDILMSSTVNSDNIHLTNKELTGGSSHEQWYRFDTESLTVDGQPVVGNTQAPVKSSVTMPHGVLLESVDGKTYMYGVEVTQGVRNQYQNCYLPAKGPDATGGACAVTAAAPYCCDGRAQASACTLF